MAKTFFPTKSIYVAASKPHPLNTQYKISIGAEIWEDNNHEVIKVQMVYDNKIAGRRSPSYPIGTNDYEKVHAEINKLLEQRNNI